MSRYRTELKADWTAVGGGGGGGGGATDLGYVASTRLLTSSTGADVTLPLFTSTEAGLTPLSGGGTTNFLRADGTWTTPSGGGSVTSVGLSAPTGFTVTNSPVTTSGTITLSFTAGYALPTTSSQTNWDTAYTDRLKWDGGATGLVAATGRTSLGLGSLATLSSISTTHIGDDQVTYAKIQNVSATDKILGRSSVGAGDIEEITCTSAGRNLLDDADASAQRTTLGLGTLATLSTVSTSNISDDQVTYAKIQNVSATDRILGRSSAGAGDIQEITCTSAGRNLLDDADASAQRTTLGLGTLATLSTVSTSNISDDQVTYAKIQNVSATDKILGRSSAGAGDVEEITCTSAGRNLLDDVDAAAQRTTLGLGTLATQSGTFSGTSSGTNTGDQTITLTGDVTGSGTGSFAATIASGAVTYAKIQDVSATDRLLGRSSAGAGVVQEITCTSAGRNLLDDADASAQRTTLGLGGAATLNVGTSVGTVAAGDDSRFTTDLSYTASTRVLASSTGTDATLPLVTSTDAGLAPASGGGTSNFLRADGTWAAPSGGGTVTSVGLSAPTGFSVANSPVTGSGTLALSFAAGYALPTTTSQTNWDTAYTDRLKWDGGATGLDASTGRTSLGLGSLATLSSVSTSNIGDDQVTYAKVQNVSATDKILGRSSAGAGDIEEITCTSAGRALLDDADATAQRTTLGLGTLATQSGTFSGTSSGTNTGDQTITLTGDVTGSGTGSFAATIASAAVTYSKIQNVSATDKILGRSSAGAGVVQEITCTSAGRDLLDDADASAQRTTLGLGTLATLSSVSTANIGDDQVTYAKIQNVSATDRILGRSSAGAGDIQEITCTSAGRALLDDADATAQRTTLGLGSIATQASSSVTITGGTMSGVQVTDYTEPKSAPTISSGTLTLNLNTAQVFDVSLNANITTLTLSNVDATSNTVNSFTLIFTMDGTARTVTWPTAVKWPGGTAPTLTSTNGKKDVFSFLSPDNGTTWLGFVGGQNF